MRPRARTLAALAAILAALPVWGHHSHANYRTTEWTYLEGTVTEIHWMNPHSWIFIEVADADGLPQVWALEGASPTTLRADGWERNDIQVGDQIKVRCHRLMDGSSGCLLGFVTPEGGVEKEYD